MGALYPGLCRAVGAGVQMQLSPGSWAPSVLRPSREKGWGSLRLVLHSPEDPGGMQEGRAAQLGSLAVSTSPIPKPALERGCRREGRGRHGGLGVPVQTTSAPCLPQHLWVPRPWGSPRQGWVQVGRESGVLCRHPLHVKQQGTQAQDQLKFCRGSGVPRARPLLRGANSGIGLGPALYGLWKKLSRQRGPARWGPRSWDLRIP